MATEPTKPGSPARTSSRPDRRSGGKLDRRSRGRADSELKKAIDRPIGEPDQAREEAPVGWDFGPDGDPLRVDRNAGGDMSDSPPPESDEFSSRSRAGEESADDGETTASSASSRAELDVGSAAGGGDADQASPPGTSDPIRGGALNPLDPGTVNPSRPQQPGQSGPDSGHPGGGAGGGGGGEESSEGGTGGGEVGTAPPLPPVRPPVAGGDDAGHVTEDAAPSTAGQLVVVSSNGVSSTWSMVGPADGQLGSFHIDSNTGQWTYTLDDRSQSLREGQSAQDIFTVRAVDGAGANVDHQVTVTITGTNDAPVIVGVTASEVVEDGTQTASGVLISSDVDMGDTATWSVGSDRGGYGSLAIDQNGTWTYTLDNDAAQGLRAGETRTDIFQVTVTDSAGATATHEVSVTIAGANDVPSILVGASWEGVFEDEISTARGQLGVLDNDIGDTVTWTVSNGHGAYGGLTINNNGSWTYTLDDDAAQELKAGETRTDIFRVTVADSAGATATHEVSVTITGTNDAPVISGTGTGAVFEDDIPTVSGTLTSFDADIARQRDVERWQRPRPRMGSISVDQNGHWTYTLDNDAAQGLKAGEQVTDIFQVTVIDSACATATRDVSVTVTGTNDAPVINGAGTGEVAEDRGSDRQRQVECIGRRYRRRRNVEHQR